MPSTTDRRIPGSRLLFIIVLSVVCLAAGVGYYYFRAHVSGPDANQNAADRTDNPLIQPAFRNEPLGVTIYYPANGALLAAPASVKRQPDTQAQARETLAAVFSDPRAAQTAVVRELRLRALFLDTRGTAYVDLSLASKQDIRASAGEELLAVYALVNTVMRNFEEIRQVAFLIDGREAQTLAGHIDLSRKFTNRMDLARQ